MCVSVFVSVCVCVCVCVCLSLRRPRHRFEDDFTGLEEQNVMILAGLF